MASLFIPTLRYFLGNITRNELKEKLVAKFMTGVSQEWISSRAEYYLKDSWKYLINKEALTHIEYDLQRGFEVTICSASPEIVLAPFAKKLGMNLIGTRLEEVDGIFTGKLIGNNCRAEEKVARLKEKYGNLDNYHLIGWGDSPGDYDLLNISQERNWRPFRGKIHIPPDFKREIEIRNIKQKRPNNHVKN